MDVENIVLTNFTYQGGDDCIAIKPRSYNIKAHNVTCHGGNGVAIGSLGQYLVDSSVANIWFDDVTVRSSIYSILELFMLTFKQTILRNEDLTDSAYIKTWVGVPTPQASYESAGLPNGGGWGTVTNILFSNFNVLGAGSGPVITGDEGDNGSYPGTSKMLISNVAFVNFTGYTSSTSNTTSSVSCSNVYPCYNIDFQNVSISNVNGTGGNMGSCQYIAPGGVHGLAGSTCT